MRQEPGGSMNRGARIVRAQVTADMTSVPAVGRDAPYYDDVANFHSSIRWQTQSIRVRS